MSCQKNIYPILPYISRDLFFGLADGKRHLVLTGSVRGLEFIHECPEEEGGGGEFKEADYLFETKDVADHLCGNPGDFGPFGTGL